MFLYNEAFTARTQLGYGSAIAAIIMVINLVVAAVLSACRTRTADQREPAHLRVAGRVRRVGVADRRVLRPADAVARLRPVQRQGRRLAAKPSSPTLGNFVQVFERDDVLPALRNSALLVAGTVAIVVVVGAPASYALSRIRFPGRDVFLYLLLLLSSVITGTAAIVPLFYLVFELDMHRHVPWRVPGARRRDVAGGDLHPQGLHRLDPAQLRGVGQGVRGVAVPGDARTSCFP